MDFKKKKIETCCQTCVLQSLLAKVQTEENAESREDSGLLCAVLVKKQNNPTGRFLRSNRIGDIKELANDLKSKCAEFQKRAEEKKKNPEVSQNGTEAHKTAATAWKKELHDLSRQYNEHGDTIASEKFTDELEAFTRARLANLKKTKILAKEEKDNKENLAAKMHKVPAILKEIRDKYDELIAPVVVPMVEKMKALTAAEKALEAAQEAISKHHKELVATHGDERLKFALMHKTLVERLKDIKDAARVDMQIAITQATERDNMHKFEKSALKLLHDSGKMNETQKKIFEDYNMALKESDGEPIPGQGRFIQEYSDVIEEIMDEIQKLDDFVNVREKCVYIVKIDEMKGGAANMAAQEIMNEELKKQHNVVLLNETNIQALTLCQEQMNDINDKYKVQLAKVATLETEKKAAEEETEKFKKERDDALKDLQEMRDFKALAERVSARPQADRRDRDDQQDAEPQQPWHRVERGRGRFAQGRHAHHDNDAQAAHGDRKRNVDAGNSHFGLRQPNGEPYCQYQFTNHDGCNKGERCKYHATHGMKDPHPEHDSRVANKRQKAQRDDHPKHEKKDRDERKKDDDADGLQ